MITQPYPNFIRPDAGGNVKPISNGLIYIGKEGLDPVSNPIDVFYIDNAGTKQKIDQPIRLNATGIPVAGENDGTIIFPYADSSVYSILITDKIGDPKYTDLTATGYALLSDLINISCGMIGGKFFPESGVLSDGDVIPNSTPKYTHLVTMIEGKPVLVSMSPVSTGEVSNLTSEGATIGGTAVKFGYWDILTVNQPSVNYYDDAAEFFSGQANRQELSENTESEIKDKKDTLVMGTSLSQATEETGIVTYESTAIELSEFNSILFNKLSQPQKNTHTNNNHAALKFKATNFPRVIGNEGTCDIFTTQGYGFTPKGTESTAGCKYGITTLNTAKVSLMFDEILGGEKGIHSLNIAVGAKPNGSRTSSHAFRIAGYNGAKAIHNSHVGNFLSGFNTGFSYQKTARYNNAVGNVIYDVNEVIQITDTQDEDGNNLPSYPQRNNRNHGVCSNVNRVYFARGGKYFDVDYIADNVSEKAVEINKSSTGEIASHNRLKGTYTNLNDDCLLLQSDCDFNRIDLIIDQCKARPFNIRSNFNIGSIIATNFSSSCYVAGSRNVLSLVLRGAQEDTGIIIEGDNNVITIYTNMKVVVSGNGNKFIGDITGEITNTGQDNDFGDIDGFVDKGKFSGDTDSDGYVNIVHDVDNYNMALCNIHGSDGSRAEVFATNPKSLRVRCFNPDNSPKASSTVTISWRVESGYAQLP